MNNLSAIYQLKTANLDIYGSSVFLNKIAQSIKLGDSKEFLEITKTAFLYGYQISQFLNKPNAEKADFSSFLYDNFNILLIILSGYLAIKLSIFVFLKLSSHNGAGFIKYLKLTLFGVTNFNEALSSTLSLLFLSLNLFLFFNLNFLSGTIKTESVIVDQTQLIDSIDEIINNDKKIIINFSDVFVLADAPGNSFFKKLYDRKREQNKILVIPQDKGVQILSKVIEQGLTKYFFFSIETSLIYVMTALSDYTDKNTICFFKSTNFYEILGVFAMRKSLDEFKKKIIHNYIDKAFENGLYSTMFANLKSISMSALEKNIKAFKNREDFIQEFTNASNVEIVNFKLIFIYFFSILAIIFIIFILNLLYNRFKSKLIHLKIVLYNSLCYT